MMHDEGSIFSFDDFPQGGFIFINCGLTKVQFLSVLIFLDEKNEMRCLEGSEYLSNAVDHVLQLDTLLFDVVLYLLQISNQLLQQLLLLLQKLPLPLDLPLLLLTQIQRIAQLDEPLVVVLLVAAEQMPSLGRRPHHVPVECGKREVHDLSEIFVDSVDALATGGSDSVAEAVDDLVELSRGVLAIFGPLQQGLDFLHHLMPAGSEAAHLHGAKSTVLF